MLIVRCYHSYGECMRPCVLPFLSLFFSAFYFFYHIMVNKDESKNLKYRKSFFRTRSIDLYAFHIDAGCHSRSIRAAILARPVQRRLSAGEIRCAADEAVKSTFKSTIALAGWLVGFAGPTHVRRWGSALANLLLATGDDCHTLPTDQRAGSGPSADDMTAWGLHRMLGCYIVMRWVLQKNSGADLQP